MCAKIALLSDVVINQIAAGEVVENPASVVKELVDNAIDGGATHITISLLGGGHEFIQVEDNGCGMDEADLGQCLLRHATSKIREVEDLDHLQTMGFRGEALAAIASVSYIEIRTSTGSFAAELRAVGGECQAIQSIARNIGTTVTVRSLFFNAPARRKFQKSAASSTTQVVRIVQQLAMSHPHIGWTLQSQGQQLLEVFPENWRDRIRHVLGEDLSEGGTWFEAHQIKGFLGDPHTAKATRLGQYFFIHQRPITSPLISKALREGFSTRILERLHPVAVLLLECAPGDCDFNAHPQKKEVRFRDEPALFSRVRREVQAALFSSGLPVPIESPFAAPFYSSSSTTAPLPLLAEYTPPPIDGGHESYWAPQSNSQPQARLVENLFEQDQERGMPLAVIQSFLLAKRGKQILLIDLRQARELEAQKKVLTQEKQMLVTPLLFSLNLEESAHSDDILKYWESAGFEIRQVSTTTLCCDAIPVWLSLEEAEELLILLKENLQDGLPLEQAIHNFCRTRKTALSLPQADYLWKKREGVQEIVLEGGHLEWLIKKEKSY